MDNGDDNDDENGDSDNKEGSPDWLRGPHSLTHSGVLVTSSWGKVNWNTLSIWCCIVLYIVDTGTFTFPLAILL